MLPFSLRTERLRLRPLHPTDAEALHGGLTDWEVIRWLAAPPHPYELSDANSFIASAPRYSSEGGRVYAIDDGAGLVGVIGVERAAAVMTLGYWLMREHWGLGIMSEAADAVVAAFFASRSDIVLASGYFEGNRASAGIQERLGFVRVGENTMASRPLGRRVAHVQTWLGRARWRDVKSRRQRMDVLIAADEPSPPPSHTQARRR